MGDSNFKPNQNEQETILTYEVSDEVLEQIVSANQATLFTIANCTGLSSCPA